MHVRAAFFLALALLAGCFQAQPVFAQAPAARAMAPASPTARPSGMFPTDYRAQIAMKLAFEYAREGRGPPEITSAVTRTGGLLSTDGTHGATVVCVQYPIEPTLINFGRTVRAIEFAGRRDVTTFGKIVFTRSTRGKGPSKCFGQTARFPELEAAARKLKACQANGQNCVVSHRVGSNGISVGPRDTNPGLARPPAPTR